MKDVGAAASSMFAVFAGGAAIGAVGSLSVLTNRSIEAADAMGKAAQKAGMAVQPFSQLSHAAGLAEVSNETLIKSFKFLGDEMIKQGRGSESLLDQILAQADVFKTMPDGIEKTARAVALFGRSGQDLIPLLNQGSDAIREQMREADELGLTVSTEFAKDANEFEDNIKKMQASLTGLGNEIAKTVLPSLVQLSEHTLQWVKDSNAVESSVNFMAAGFVGLKQVVEDVNDALDAMARIGKTIQIPGFGNVGKGQKPPGITPTDLGIFIHPAPGSLPSINPNQDYGGAGMGGSGVAPITPIAAGLKSEADAIQQAQDMYQRHEEFLQQQAKRTEEFRRRSQDAVLDNASRTLGMGAALAASYGRKGFALYQGLAIGEAIMSTAAGVTRAFRDYMWPYSAVVAALVGAQGAIQIATIASQKPPAAHGGLDFVPAETTYLLNRGERVLSPRQNEDLTSALESGGLGGAIHIHLMIDGRELGTAVYDGSRNGTLAVHP